MHIIYAVSTCSEETYHKLFANVKDKPAFQSQKYHRLLIEGLAENAQVDVVANPPVNRNVMSQAFVHLPKEEAGGATYHNLPALRNPIAKMAVVGIGTFFKTLFLSRKDSVVIVDALQRVTAFSALQAAPDSLRCHYHRPAGYAGRRRLFCENGQFRDSACRPVHSSDPGHERLHRQPEQALCGAGRPF